MTLQIELKPELLRKLESLAETRGQSTAEIVVDLLTSGISEQRTMALPSWVGSAESGKPDLGVNADDYLFKTLAVK